MPALGLKEEPAMGLVGPVQIAGKERRLIYTAHPGKKRRIKSDDIKALGGSSET